MVGYGPHVGARRMIYEGNPKHKEPWQLGRRGSLCPREITLAEAQELLNTSVAIGSVRYATSNGKAFCAREHRTGMWHGYPVSWREVPALVRQNWEREGVVKRSDIRNNW